LMPYIPVQSKPITHRRGSADARARGSACCGAAGDLPPTPPESPMSTEPDAPPAPPGAPPAVTPERVLAGIALAVPVVALLWVSSYAKLTPKLLGMPFFYWYQILWIPVSALFTGAAYLLLVRDEKTRRATRGGEPR
jgi:hypothetical protein